MLRVLQISTVYGKGSVGRIMADLYTCTEAAGVEAYVATGRSRIPEGVRGYRIGNLADMAVHVAGNILWDKGGFCSAVQTGKFLQWVDRIHPDVIHLHNIHGFYLQIEMLFDYIKRHDIPVVWTLHDCWPMTGHCAYFDYVKCNKWENGCNHCPQHLQSYPYSVTDNSSNNYQRKKAAFTGVKNLTIAVPSAWLAGIVKKSFLKEYNIRVIPNGIDLARFRVIDGIKEKAEDRKIILGVANVWDRRKGLEYFLQLSELLDDTYVIYLVGVSKKQKRMLQQKYNSRVIPVMHTDSAEELVELYNRALVFVNPTLEDNFPTTNLEALACGTPVITFRTGGSPEALCGAEVICGYVTEKGAVPDIAERVRYYALKNRKEVADACRKQAMRYSKAGCFGEYIELYQNI